VRLGMGEGRDGVMIYSRDACPFQADKFYGWNQDSAFVESVIGCLS
jgi:hypothetical protein